MSREYQVQIEAHPSVYTDNARSNPLDIVFNEPEAGINDETGILLLIQGFGEAVGMPHMVESRSTLADRHNMIVVQCNYFGYEFMQDSHKTSYHVNLEALSTVFSPTEMEDVYHNKTLNMQRLFEIGQHYDIHLEGAEELQETEDYFNDMGIMQAIDNLSALHAVAAILHDNGYKINTFRTHVLGQGHGGYLAYLCNALAPNLFTAVIENSAWLFPTYLAEFRVLENRLGKMNHRVIFHYLASKLPSDKNLQYLPGLYRTFRNRACIISFHGSDDHLTGIRQKREFCDSLPMCNLHVVSNENTDHAILRSSAHGLGTNIQQLYSYALEKNSIMKPIGFEEKTFMTTIETRDYTYTADFSSGMPVVKRNKKAKL